MCLLLGQQYKEWTIYNLSHTTRPLLNHHWLYYNHQMSESKIPQNERVSDCFSANWAIYSYIVARTFQWDDDAVFFALTNTLVHWSNSPRIDMFHSDTLSWIRANQSFLLLLNAYRRSNKYQFYKSLVWPESDVGPTPRSTSLDANTLPITSPLLFYHWMTLNSWVPFYQYVFSLLLDI